MAEVDNSGAVQFARQAKRGGRLSLRTKIIQGFGSLPSSHKDFAFKTLLLLYYTQILGLAATTTSGVLAVALLVDAVTDPLVGAYSDQLKTRLGRRHPLMYAASVPLGIAMYLLFSPPDGLSETQLALWLLAIVLVLHLAFTFFAVPWNALGAEFSDDYEERTSIIAYRLGVGWVGGVVFNFAMLTLAFAATAAYPQGQLNPDAYGPFAVILGARRPAGASW